MAITLTTSYKQIGKVSLSSSYATEFRLYAKVSAYDVNTNSTPVTTKITFYRSTGTYSFGSATGKITGSVTGTKTYTTTTTMKKGETTILETTKDITHNSDGTRTITLGASWVDSYLNETKKVIEDVECTLPKIPRASSLVTSSTFVNFGDSVRIDIGRNVSSYRDTITWVGYYPKDNGDGSYDLQAGEPSSVAGTIVEKTSATFVNWAIPDELSTLIPTFRMVGVKLTCSTYNGNTLIGTTEKWLSIRLVEENAKPLITKSYVETNTQIIDQLGTDNFSIPVLNVSQPKFTFSATPRYNATIKSLKIICDDGQESSKSPYTFKPIGSAKFSIVAVDSREYTTTIPINLTTNAIPYIKPNIKTLEAVRKSPISGEIIISAKGSWYGGTMIDDIENPLYTNYKCKINGSEEIPLLVQIPSEAVTLDDDKNEWSINDYSLGGITEYDKNYDFTLVIGDYYYSEIESTTLIRKGVATFDYGEDDLQVNGDLFVADKNRQNKVNVLNSIYYKSGDNFDLNLLLCAGILTSGKKQVIFTIPFDKKTDKINTITGNFTNVQIRHADGGYIANGVDLSTIGTISIAKATNNTARVTLELTTASEFTNNCPVVVYIVDGNIVFN